MRGKAKPMRIPEGRAAIQDASNSSPGWAVRNFGIDVKIPLLGLDYYSMRRYQHWLVEASQGQPTVVIQPTQADGMMRLAQRNGVVRGERIGDNFRILHVPRSRGQESHNNQVLGSSDVMAELRRIGSNGTHYSYIPTEGTRRVSTTAGLRSAGAIQLNDGDKSRMRLSNKWDCYVAARECGIPVPPTVGREIDGIESLAEGLGEFTLVSPDILSFVLKTGNNASGQGNAFLTLGDKVRPNGPCLADILKRYLGPYTRATIIQKAFETATVHREMQYDKDGNPKKLCTVLRLGPEFAQYGLEGAQLLRLVGTNVSWKTYKEELEQGGGICQKRLSLIADPSVQGRMGRGLAERQTRVRSWGMQDVIDDEYQGWGSLENAPYLGQMLEDSERMFEWLEDIMGMEDEAGIDYGVAIDEKGGKPVAYLLEVNMRPLGNGQYIQAAQDRAAAEFNSQAGKLLGPNGEELSFRGSDNNKIHTIRYLPLDVDIDILRREGCLKGKDPDGKDWVVDIHMGDAGEEFGKFGTTTIAPSLSQADANHGRVIDALSAYTRGRKISATIEEVIPAPAGDPQEMVKMVKQAKAIQTPSFMKGSHSNFLRSTIPSADGRWVVTLANLSEEELDQVTVYSSTGNGTPVSMDIEAFNVERKSTGRPPIRDICYVGISNEQKVVMADINGVVMVGDGRTGQIERVVLESQKDGPIDRGLPTSIAFEGSQLAVSYRQKQTDGRYESCTFTHNLNTGHQVRIQGSGSWRHSACFVQRQGKQVLAIGDDTHVRGYDPTTGEEVFEVRVSSPVVGLAASHPVEGDVSGSARLAAVTSGCDLHIINVDTGEIVKTKSFKLKDGVFLRQPTFSPDNKMIAVRTSKGDLLTCSTDNLNLSYVVDPKLDHVGRHESAVGPPIFAGDDTVVIINGQNGMRTELVLPGSESTPRQLDWMGGFPMHSQPI